MADTMALETPQGVFQTNEATSDELLVENNDVAMREVEEKNSQSTSLVKSSNVTEFLAKPLVKRTIPGVIGLFLVLLFLVIYFSVTAVGSRALYPSMSETDRSEAFAQLQSANIPVYIDQNLGTLMVPDDEYYQARMLLAANGLPSDGSTQALDSLSAASSMTTSQFMEQAQYTATIEGEIAKSIMRISTIESARVHLAAPRQSSYIRNRQPAKASVVLETYPGRVVSPSQVQAIINLVASSVPYLSIDDVSVVDQMGSLLSDREASSGLLEEANEQAVFKRNLEAEYHNKIMRLLSPIVGSTNVRSDVDITVDFSEFESTAEIFDRSGTGPSTRSEMMQVDTSAVTPATGIPGETSNVAPQDTVLVDANVLANESDSTNIRSSQTTRNYEVDREIQYQKSSSGDITKLSVAVVLNRNAISELTLGNEESVDAFDVSGIRSLVASAVGIDESRGDSIMVLVSQFRGEDPEADVIWYENNSIRNYATMGLALVGFILFLILIIKPIIVGIYGITTKPGATKLLEKKDDNEDVPLTDAEIAEMDIYSNQGGKLILKDGEKVLRSEDDIKARAEETGETLEELKARLAPKKSNVSVDMFDTANTYDDKVNIVRMLVDEDSSRVASLLKKMVASQSAPT
jgi:flagellar M-ring protein FliF